MLSDRFKSKYLALTVEGLELDLSFSKQEDAQKIVGAIKGKNNQPVTLDKAFVGKISPEVAELIPEGLKIDLNNVLFGFNKKRVGKSQVLFGANFGAEIQLSQLPFIGKVLPPGQNFGVDTFQILVSSDQWEATDVTEINRLIPPQVSKIPPHITKGANFSAVIEIAGKKELLFLPANNGSKTNQAQQKNQSQAVQSSPAVKSGNQPKNRPAAQPGMIMWIPINKTVGPITFKRIGGRFHQKKIYLMLDTQMAMGPLTVTLEGLSIGTPVEQFKPEFNLNGLGISYQKGPTAISGAFLRDASDDSYRGMAVIKTPKLNIAALGAYKEINGRPSVFIYAVLNLAVGVGPAFFQVTGISAGFGYNRTVKVPEVTGVKSFPLVSVVTGGQDLGKDPMTVLNRIKSTIPASPGSLFFAFGLKFSSFKILNSFALLILRLENKIKLDILGISKMSVPTKSPNPSVQVELAIKASYDFYENSLKVDGILTPASYIFSKNCRLTGGFAFYSWFAGKHSGDFVYTMGGYHPKFKVPAHYPRVARLGFHWQVIPELTIKGNMYYALVSSAIMAGGRLEALFQIKRTAEFDIGICGASLTGIVKAYFIIGADFIISWKPFYYEASMYMKFGIKVTFRGKAWFNLLFTKISKSVEKSFDINLGASLRIWGPDFAGVATIDWSIVSFDIEFGGGKSKPARLTWSEFKNSFLPKNDESLSITIEDGLTRQLENGVRVINPADLAIGAESVIPSVTTNTKSGGTTISGKSFGVATMGVSRMNRSEFKLEITKRGSQNNILEKDFTCTPIEKNMPERMWGKQYDTNMNSGLVKDLLTGIRITPKAKIKPNQTEEKNVSDFHYDTETRNQAYEWEEPMALQSEKIDGFSRRKVVRNNHQAAAVRNRIIRQLGLNPSQVDLSHLRKNTQDAFLVAPEITKAA